MARTTGNKYRSNPNGKMSKARTRLRDALSLAQSSWMIASLASFLIATASHTSLFAQKKELEKPGSAQQKPKQITWRKSLTHACRIAKRDETLILVLAGKRDDPVVEQLKRQLGATSDFPKWANGKLVFLHLETEPSNDKPQQGNKLLAKLNGKKTPSAVLLTHQQTTLFTTNKLKDAQAFLMELKASIVKNRRTPVYVYRTHLKNHTQKTSQVFGRARIPHADGSFSIQTFSSKEDRFRQIPSEVFHVSRSGLPIRLTLRNGDVSDIRFLKSETQIERNGKVSRIKIDQESLARPSLTWFWIQNPKAGTDVNEQFLDPTAPERKISETVRYIGKEKVSISRESFDCHLVEIKHLKSRLIEKCWFDEQGMFVKRIAELDGKREITVLQKKESWVQPLSVSKYSWGRFGKRMQSDSSKEIKNIGKAAKSVAVSVSDELIRLGVEPNFDRKGRRKADEKFGNSSIGICGHVSRAIRNAQIGAGIQPDSVHIITGMKASRLNGRPDLSDVLNLNHAAVLVLSKRGNFVIDLWAHGRDSKTYDGFADSKWLAMPLDRWFNEMLKHRYTRFSLDLGANKKYLYRQDFVRELGRKPQATSSEKAAGDPAINARRPLSSSWTSEKWRKCMGIEPTSHMISMQPNGFEDRAGHQPWIHFQERHQRN